MESKELAALILKEGFNSYLREYKESKNNHRFCAELCLECLLRDLKLIFVVDLIAMRMSSQRRLRVYSMRTYRSEVHQVDHAISESLYLDVDPLIPFFLHGL